MTVLVIAPAIPFVKHTEYMALAVFFQTCYKDEIISDSEWHSKIFIDLKD